MNTKQSNVLASPIAAAFERDGFWIERDLLSADECDALKTEALRVLREKGKPNGTVYVGVAAASPMYYKLADDRRFVSILEQIMPDGVMFMSDKFVFKSAKQTFPTPWHIDKFYWEGTRPKMSIWIPLDDAMTINGTLKVVRGSHKLEWKVKNPTDTSVTNNEFVNVIDNQQWDPRDEVTCELKRGGAVFFSDRLAHASCPNTAGLDRYTIISTYHAPAADEAFDGQFPARHVISEKR